MVMPRGRPKHKPSPNANIVELDRTEWEEEKKKRGRGRPTKEEILEEPINQVLDLSITPTGKTRWIVAFKFNQYEVGWYYIKEFKMESHAVKEMQRYKDMSLDKQIKILDIPFYKRKELSYQVIKIIPCNHKFDNTDYIKEFGFKMPD